MTWKVQIPEMNWYVVAPFLVYLGINLFIGFYSHRILRKTSLERFEAQYYVAGRDLGPIVLAFTLTTSMVSAGTFLGAPALGYRDGFVWLVISSGQIGSTLLILGVLGKKFAIVARRTKAYTVPRVLAARFPHPFIGGASATIMVFFLSFYMSAQFIGGGLILETIAGVPYGIALVLMVFTTVAYTSIGGYKAVVLTDTLQGALMLFGVGGLFFAIVDYAGGMVPLMTRLIELDPRLVSADAGHSYRLRTIISTGWILIGIGLIGLPHATVRALSFKDSRALHHAIVLSTIIMFFLTFMMLFAGVTANVVLGPDIEDPDSVIPQTITALFPPFWAGIFLGAPFAAIMSTVSSMLLVCSSGLVGDIYVDSLGGRVSPKGRAVLDRLITVILGTAVFFMALSRPPFLQSVVFYAVGGLASCFLVPLLFGLYWPRANVKGAVASICTGTAGYFVIATFYPNLLAFHDVTWSIGLAALAMIVVSLLTEKPPYRVIKTFWGTSAERHKS